MHKPISHKKEKIHLSFVILPELEILLISVLVTSSTCNFNAAMALFVASKEK